MKVQRGNISLTGSILSDEIELVTPVSVGNSFIISSARSSMIEPESPPEGDPPEEPGEPGEEVLFSAQVVREVLWEPEVEPSLSKTMCKLELIDVVDGNYTKIKATRANYFDGHDVTVEWQVIYGSEFTVQTGSINCDDDTLSVEQPITQVDLECAFIVHTNSTNCEYGAQVFFEVEFDGDDKIIFTRHSGELGDVNSIQWFVIEWVGASVHNGSVVLINESISASIPTVDRSKAFLLYSYISWSDEENSESNIASLVFFNGEIIADDEVLFTTYAERAVDNIINFFVIEHPDLFVQYGNVTISGYSDTIVLDSNVDVDRYFTPTTQLGNAYTDEAANQSLNCCYNTHRLFKDGNDYKVIIERDRALEGNIYVSWFVVGYFISVPTVSTLPCSNVTFVSFKANGDVTNAGGVEILKRGFCYLRNSTGIPTIENSSVYEEGLFDAEEYNLIVSGLGTSRDYRVRAFAENVIGLSYGSVVSCLTDSTDMVEFRGTEVEDIGYVNKFKTPRH